MNLTPEEQAFAEEVRQRIAGMQKSLALAQQAMARLTEECATLQRERDEARARVLELEGALGRARLMMAKANRRGS